MGRETTCLVEWGGLSARAKVHLDSQSLKVGPPFRLDYPLKTVLGAEEDGTWVRVQLNAGPLALELGEGKAWIKGLLHPPSLLDKWGLSSGQAWQCLGAWPGDLTPLLPAQPGVGSPVPLVLLTTPTELPLLIQAAKALDPGGNLWVVIPRGDRKLPESLVFQAASGTGLRPTKVAAVSDRWTSHRFTRSKG
jgi:hypothetical protein